MASITNNPSTRTDRRSPWPRLIAYGAIALALVIVAIMAATGCYTVQPGEAAAVQTFGAARAEPVDTKGLHWHWPRPIGKVTTVQVRNSRTAEVGFHWLPDDKIADLTGENWQRDLQAATMITGDLNLLETQVVAHYYISDLNKYLFHADDPGVEFAYLTDDKEKSQRSHPRGRPDGQTIRDAVEIAIRRTLGQRTIDEALVSQRETIETETQIHAQELLDMYQTGISISSIQLQEVKPPDEVQVAFDDVLHAREEKEKRINEALAFESQTLPEARGQAERIRQEAKAYKAQRINAAEGEVSRYLNILEEYRANPDIIAKRIYLETVEKVLVRTRQIIIANPEAGPVIINASGSQVIPAR